jgi:hypothetical protein
MDSFEFATVGSHHDEPAAKRRRRNHHIIGSNRRTSFGQRRPNGRLCGRILLVIVEYLQVL